MLTPIFQQPPYPASGRQGDDVCVTGQYGKTKVRVARILREDDVRHDFQEFDVECLLEGSINASFSASDNSVVVPTDTVKNTIYMVAMETINTAVDPEDFAQELNAHLLHKHQHLSCVTTTITVIGWTRLPCPPSVSNKLTDSDETCCLHPHTFLGQEANYVCCVITGRGEDDLKECDYVTEAKKPYKSSVFYHQVTSGIKNLRVLKTTKSGFIDYIRDDYTTLQPTQDRVLSTYIYARWPYASRPKEGYSAANKKIKAALVEQFVGDREKGTYSPSVQGTMYEMGGAALRLVKSAGYIDIELPNIHYIPFRNSHMPETMNNNDVLIGTSAPSGLIKCRVLRKKL